MKSFRVYHTGAKRSIYHADITGDSSVLPQMAKYNSLAVSDIIFERRSKLLKSETEIQFKTPGRI